MIPGLSPKQHWGNHQRPLPLAFTLSCFAISLVPQAYLLLETVSGQGENYLELPHQGELRAALEPPSNWRSMKNARRDRRSSGGRCEGACASKILTPPLSVWTHTSAAHLSATLPRFRNGFGPGLIRPAQQISPVRLGYLPSFNIPPTT